MKTEDKDQNQNNVLEGYNPGVYRSLSILFIILTILNIAVTVFAFAVTGYGLWHAEDALSCIAKVDSSFDDINQSILEIELHADDAVSISNRVDRIITYYKDIQKTAENFRGINLKNIDATIPERFESAMDEIDRYYNKISNNLDEVKNGSADPGVLDDTETRLLREDAADSMNKLFEKADAATYKFFCKVGQRFLLVLLFLLLTMISGLMGISQLKKRDLKTALELESSKKKTANIRQKAVEIAYTNVVTGQKNRYALMEELDERMKTEDITIALYNFNHFSSVKEKYGRDYADDFMAYVSKKLVKTFGEQAEIFTTETDEFCIVFNKDIPKSKTTGISQKILYTLSQPVQIRSARIQLTAAGCLCYSRIGAYPSAAKLFVAMDYSIRQTKTMCAEQNRSLILPIQ